MGCRARIYLWMNWPAGHHGGVDAVRTEKQVMKVELTADGLKVTPDLSERVGRRIHFALGRFAGRIKNVSVRLADVNGPRGGVDKACTVRIQAGLRRALIIREQQSDIHTAVAIAAERAGRSITRQLNLHR